MKQAVWQTGIKQEALLGCIKGTLLMKINAAPG